MPNCITAVWKFVRDETGAAMVEYTLMIAIVPTICVLAVNALGMAFSGSPQAWSSASEVVAEPGFHPSVVAGPRAIDTTGRRLEVVS